MVSSVSLEGVEWNPEHNTGKTTPLTIKTETELKKLLGEADAAKVKDRIDFAKDNLVLFQWSGSGRDKVVAVVEEKVVVFQVQQGLTKDLRRHRLAFAVKKGTDWKIAKIPFGKPGLLPRAKP